MVHDIAQVEMGQVYLRQKFKMLCITNQLPFQAIPFRKAGNEFYDKYKNHLFEIGARLMERKRDVRKRYREISQRVMNVQVRDISCNDLTQRR